MERNEGQETLGVYIVQSLRDVVSPNLMEEALMAAALRLQSKGSIFKRRMAR